MDGGRRISQKVKGASVKGSASRAAAPLSSSKKSRKQKSQFSTFLSRWSVPAGIGTLASAAFMAGTLFYAFHVSEQKELWVKRAFVPFDLAANFAGFKLERIEISGLNRLRSEEIHKALDLSSEASALWLDVEQTRHKIAALPLVQDVTVRKLLPHDLYIQVQERTPFALWQNDGHLYLVSQDGTILSKDVDDRYRDLPFVVGEGANKRLKEAVDLVEVQLSLRSRIRAISLVAGRRWNLVTHDGILIRLPEENPKKALMTLAALEHAGSLLSKDILSVDLRMNDRAVVRLSEKAAQERAVTTASILKRRPL